MTVKKQKNLLKRDRVYCITENPFEGYLKIGKSDADAGRNKGPDDWYERTRALEQGNWRILETAWYIPIKGDAGKFEKKVHEECRKRGIINRYDETGITGHREWWKMTPEQARWIANDVYDSEYGIVQDTTLFHDGDDNQIQIGY